MAMVTPAASACCHNNANMHSSIVWKSGANMAGMPDQSNAVTSCCSATGEHLEQHKSLGQPRHSCNSTLQRSLVLLKQHVGDDAVVVLRSRQSICLSRRHSTDRASALLWCWGYVCFSSRALSLLPLGLSSCSCGGAQAVSLWSKLCKREGVAGNGGDQADTEGGEGCASLWLWLQYETRLPAVRVEGFQSLDRQPSASERFINQ